MEANSLEMKFYSVTSLKPTAVTEVLSCSFSGADVTNVVLAKGNVLEVRTFESNLTDAGGMDVDGEAPSYSLVPLEDLTLNGRVVSMHAFRPKDELQDRLFVLTEHKHFCVLGYEAEAKKVTTLACGNLESVVGRHPESGIRCIMDPMNRMIAMILYDGHLKLLPMNANGGFLPAFDERILSITRVTDIVFLHGTSKPTLAILYEDDDYT